MSYSIRKNTHDNFSVIRANQNYLRSVSSGTRRQVIEILVAFPEITKYTEISAMLDHDRSSVGGHIRKMVDIVRTKPKAQPDTTEPKTSTDAEIKHALGLAPFVPAIQMYSILGDNYVKFSDHMDEIGLVKKIKYGAWQAETKKLSNAIEQGLKMLIAAQSNWNKFLTAQGVNNGNEDR